MLLGLVTFCVALAGFLLLGLQAQSSETRVLVAARTIAVGQVLQATTADLAPGGALVHLGAGAQSEAIPESDYRSVGGAVALVTIPRGTLILRNDLAYGDGSSLRQLTLNLSFIPAGLSAGDRVDLFAVSGPEAGGADPGTDLCGSGGGADGCVVPLAQSVAVLAANSGARTLTISVRPAQVAPWLLIDATQSIWAVPAGALACEGTEQAISDPYQALLAIRRGTAARSCSAVGGRAAG